MQEQTISCSHLVFCQSQFGQFIFTTEISQSEFWPGVPVGNDRLTDSQNTLITSQPELSCPCNIQHFRYLLPCESLEGIKVDTYNIFLTS